MQVFYMILLIVISKIVNLTWFLAQFSLFIFYYLFFQLNVESQLTLEVCYYNNLLALWEPLVEPVDTKEGKKTSYIPWELFVQVIQCF